MYIFFSSIFGVSCGSFVDISPPHPYLPPPPALPGPPFHTLPSLTSSWGEGAAGGEWCS